MPLLKKIPVNNGLLILWSIRESLEVLEQMIPEALEDPRYRAISHIRRKREWLAVRLLMREVNCPAGQLFYAENGQPRLNNPTYKHISISHSDSLAGIFLHPSQAVGLDIEQADRDFIRIEQKYLSPEEQELARTISGGHGLFWCIKEAVYKLADTPGLHFARQIRIFLQEDSKLAVTLITGTTKTFQVNHFEIEGQLIVCLVDEKKNEV
ncbi:4'-phosphopantetheinyl transferase superfamily protein [Gaoshiqia sp. Z1-71]|uniref:4'-phosphopantetheinyl transferase superfamily protein n=1 Tax=Gaoshiqia hydrogeniformans TaxID=3290090 RepID=UPI003BF859AF